MTFVFVVTIILLCCATASFAKLSPPHHLPVPLPPLRDAEHDSSTSVGADGSALFHWDHQRRNTRVSAAQLPLSVSGPHVVDKSGAKVKLACVNWYGAEELDFVVGGIQWQSIDTIAGLIADYGFNCIRLPFSLELVDKNPTLTDNSKIKQEPSLYGHRAMDVLDAVISSLAKHQVMVILDNHMSDANWCCSGNDGNGLWYTASYSAADWLRLWGQITQRYASNPYVIGCDLRNELRQTTISGHTYHPTWGSGNTQTDWRLAAIDAIKAIQKVNPNLLMIVEGINYALDLTGIASHPILDADVTVPRKILYSCHSYSWDYSNTDYNALSNTFNKQWAYIFQNTNAAYTAPVWMGEFGECHDNTNSCLKSQWWQSITRYLQAYDVPYGYWAIDGTESTGSGRKYGSMETYGVLNMTWNGAYHVLLSDLQKLQ